MERFEQIFVFFPGAQKVSLHLVHDALPPEEIHLHFFTGRDAQNSNTATLGHEFSCVGELVAFVADVFLVGARVKVGASVGEYVQF